ncbi:MAG: DMT family transporter [Desulfomicrobium escambiense]|nr:DMT family transporter [Desulfomicrobium escambiense]
MGPLTFNGIRFLLGGASLLPLIYLRRRMNRTAGPGDSSRLGRDPGGWRGFPSRPGGGAHRHPGGEPPAVVHEVHHRGQSRASSQGCTWSWSRLAGILSEAQDAGPGLDRLCGGRGGCTSSP